MGYLNFYYLALLKVKNHVVKRISYVFSKFLPSKALLLLLLLGGTTIQGQDTLRFNKRMTSFGPQPVVELPLPHAPKDLIVDVWKSYLRPYGKVRYNKKAGEYYLEDAEIPSIHPSSKVDLYFIAEDSAAIAFAFVDKDFIDQQSPHASRFVQFLQSFRREVELERLRRTILAAEKELKSLQRKLRKLEKRERKLHRTIQQAEQTLREAREELPINKKHQRETLQAIQAQQQRIKNLLQQLDSVKQNAP